MRISVLAASAYILLISGIVWADTFGTGENQFALNFVTISGDTNPTSGIPAGNGFTFTGVDNNYRMGVYEITIRQWNKFSASLGVPVTGNPSEAYSKIPYWPWLGEDIPMNNVSWYESA